MKEMGNNLGKRLKELRLAKNLTLRELAESVKDKDFKVDFTYLSKIENNRTEHPPSLKLLQRLAKALDADIDELAALAGQIPPSLKEVARSKEALEFLRSASKIQPSKNTWRDLLGYIEKQTKDYRKEEP